MTAKEYLNQARHLDRLINAKVRCIAKLKKDIGILQSPRLTDKVQCSSDGASSVRIIDKIVDLEYELDNDIDRLVSLKHEIISKIDNLDNNIYKSILIDYYINGLTLEKIAEIISFSDRDTRRKYSIALKKFAQIHNLS